MPSDKPTFKRVLIKLSGEFLMGQGEYGICSMMADRVSSDIKAAVDLGVEVCMVIGGGNIFRGVSKAAEGMDRTAADHMGMLATVINALAMQNALERAGVDTRVQSAFKIESVCEPYIRRRAMRHMDKGRVVIFAAGTGNPFFTTDTAAALRASEMNCNAIIKATKVDGIYDSDPEKNPDAKRFKTISFMDVLSKDLKVMDATAISLARASDIPIIVFSIKNQGALSELLQGRGNCTVVTTAERIENKEVRYNYG